MIVTGLEIDNFRSVERVRFLPKPGLNVMVGENNVGKSAIFLAMSKLLASGFGDIDHRYGSLQPGLRVTGKFEVNGQENDFLLGQIAAGAVERGQEKLVRGRLEELGKELLLSYEWDQAGQRAWMQIGPLFLKDNWATDHMPADGGIRQWSEFLRELVRREEPLPAVLRRSEIWESSGIQGNAMTILRARLRGFAETRPRPAAGQRSSVLESFTGGDTASVLLNLRMHHDLHESQKYNRICEEFSSFFPYLTVKAVEQSPGSGIPLIQVIDNFRQLPVPLEQAGAGVAEVLTFITNLMGREGQVIVVEEPELHLHPQAKRRLMTLIRDSAKRNQVFVITHDPIFVDCDQLESLIRVWMTNKGTNLAQMPDDLDVKSRGQLQTGLRDPTKRELLFSRAVLLVEDESQGKAVLGFARTLGEDLDAAGVSVISYDGEDGWPPYVKLLEAFEIPFLVLRDKRGGLPNDQRFRWLDEELEDFFRSGGLELLLEEAAQQVGTSKRRIAEYVGQQATRNMIPEFFKNLIDELVGLAKAPGDMTVADTK